jgi:PAS domain S-box-containing protein
VRERRSEEPSKPERRKTDVDLKLAEEALFENEAEYRALINASSQVLYSMNPDWSEMRQLKGGNFLADTEKPNRNWLQEYIHPDDQKLVLDTIGEAVRTGSVFELEHRVRRVDGTLGWTLSRAVPIRNAAGEIVKWIGAASDITESKRTEELLRESQRNLEEKSAELETIIDTMPAGIWIFHDPGCSLITGNRVARQILGELEGGGAPENERPWREIRKGGVPISPDQLLMHTACASGQEVHGEAIEVEGIDGATRQLYGDAVPLFDSNNNVRGSIGVLVDITKLKEAHDKIAGLAAIVDSSTDAIIGKTLEGIIVSWNPGAEALYGYSDNEAIGRSISFLLAPDHPDDILIILEKIRHGETIASYDTVRMRKDGSLVDVALTVSPVRDSTGKIIGASTVARDISERKKYEERIKQYSEELERSNRELNDFASIVSHDLRAPLRAVSGFTVLLQKRYKQKLDAEADRYLSHIVEGTERMNHLIADLIEYSRVARREITVAPLNVNTVIEKTLDNLTFEIQESDAVITVDPLPTVSGNSTQLIQLFQNLIGNAIKYCNVTPNIHISAERKKREWLFRVRDNGIGIDPQQFDRIFQIFQRLHAIDEYSGTGIGLAVCKKIVENLGGHIWVESKPSEGSTFFFTLPIVKGRVTNRD